jgi:hypothetical protein
LAATAPSRCLRGRPRSRERGAGGRAQGGARVGPGGWGGGGGGIVTFGSSVVLGWLASEDGTLRNLCVVGSETRETSYVKKMNSCLCVAVEGEERRGCVTGLSVERRGV